MGNSLAIVANSILCNDISDSLVAVRVSNRAIGCGVPRDPCAVDKDGTDLGIFVIVEVEEKAGAVGPVGAGTYTVGPENTTSSATALAMVAETTTDSVCNVASHVARSGTVTVTSVGVVVTGSYDVTMDDGRRFRNTFNAPSCGTITVGIDMCDPSASVLGRDKCSDKPSCQ